MSDTLVNRKIINPRWRASSATLVPDEDFDYDEYVPTHLRKEEDVPPASMWRALWQRANTSNNRVVTPVLKNPEGNLYSDNRPFLDEDPFSPWR